MRQFEFEKNALYVPKSPHKNLRVFQASPSLSTTVTPQTAQLGRNLALMARQGRQPMGLWVLKRSTSLKVKRALAGPRAAPSLGQSISDQSFWIGFNPSKYLVSMVPPPQESSPSQPRRYMGEVGEGPENTGPVFYWQTPTSSAGLRKNRKDSAKRAVPAARN